MRYLLLFGILIAASVTLPFATLSEEPATAQPVEPVDVVTLPPMDDTVTLASAEVPSGSAAASTPEALLPVDTKAEIVADAGNTPRGAMPGMVTGNMALGMVSAVPFGLLPHLFDDRGVGVRMTGDAAKPAEDDGLDRFAALGIFPAMPDASGEGPDAQPEAAEMPEGQGDSPETVVSEAPADPAPEVEAPGESLASVEAPDDDRSIPLAPATEEVGSLVMNANSDPIVIATISGYAAPDAEPQPEPEAAPEVTEVAEPADPAVDAELFKVTANALNMRAGPSSSHAVVTGLAKGALAERIGDTRNGWVPVRVKDGETTGWVFARYLARAEGA